MCVVCFCRVASSVFSVLCFETDTYSILILLLHENVLQKNYVCRVDLSGNFTLSKWVRSHRTWKNLYCSVWDNLPVGFGEFGNLCTSGLLNVASMKA